MDGLAMDDMVMEELATNRLAGSLQSNPLSLFGPGLGAMRAQRASRQTTLKTAIGCVGTGLHSARRVSLHIRPAPAGTGIVFRRTDLDAAIPARFDHVADTKLCTVLALPERPDIRVGTVEHLMAALAGSFIDNAFIDIDGPELPIFDGSAAPFLFLLDCAGTEEQDAPRPVIEIRRIVRVEAGGAYAELRPLPPNDRSSLDMALSIDFAAPAIGRQALSLLLTRDGFRHHLAHARTFTFADEVASLRAAGLALGGSLENAVVVDGNHVLNPEGLRSPDEFVRHKLLDVVGDLALAGRPIVGRLVAHCTGHTLNNRLLHALFADASAWQETGAGRDTWFPAAA